jgi:hypothetical protein
MLRPFEFAKISILKSLEESFPCYMKCGSTALTVPERGLSVLTYRSRNIDRGYESQVFENETSLLYGSFKMKEIDLPHTVDSCKDFQLSSSIKHITIRNRPPGHLVFILPLSLLLLPLLRYFIPHFHHLLRRYLSSILRFLIYTF